MTNTPHTSLHIGFDLDGIGYDFVEALRTFRHRAYGVALDTMPAPTTWNFFADDWGMTLGEFLTEFAAGVDAGHIFTHGDPTDDYMDAIAAIVDAGHHAHIVTDRAVGSPGVAQAATHGWLARYGSRHTSVTFSADKTAIVHNGVTIRPDVFIEDKPANFEALRAAGITAFLRDRAYNRHVDAGEYRVHSVAEYVTRVHELAAARAAA